MSGILIVADAAGDQLPTTTVELASEGRRLAERLQQPLLALVAGKDPWPQARALGQFGVGRVLLAQATGEVPASSEWLLAAAERAARLTEPDVILASHSDAGRGLVPALAFRLGSGAVTDCTAIRVEDGRLVFTKPVYGGSAIAELEIVAGPQVASLRPRAFEAAEPAPGPEPSVEAIEVATESLRTEVLEEVREQASQGPRLKDAKVVVAGGRGLGSPDNWRYVEELASVLGAAVGATRAVTDAGWVPPSSQVGLTGATVAPDLYVAIGISGAVQHVAGISGARNVVAINRDPDANIFKYARYGVVGDWKQVLPAFTQRLRELRG